ncbi:2349_t:CDS:1, partial [Gigaspora rosea]
AIINKLHPYHKILDSSLWNDILTKSNLPNCTIFSIILPPRNIPHVVESSPSTHCQEFNTHLNSIITSLLY